MPWVDGVYVMPGGTDPPGLFDRWPEDTYGECIDPLCDECPRKRRRRQAAPPAFKRNQAVSPKATKDDRPTLVESSSISNNRAGTSSSPLPFARPERTHLRPWLLEASRIVSEGCEQQERLPCEIASWLFIGDVATAASVEILKALKVTHVLNAAGGYNGMRDGMRRGRRQIQAARQRRCRWVCNACDPLGRRVAVRAGSMRLALW